jgi:5-methylcytosine-specific restriction endonuclease McrA
MDQRYSLATLPCVLNGLHAVRFLVVEASTGVVVSVVVSVADTKLEALAGARNLLRVTAQLRRREDELREMEVRQSWLWPPETLKPPRVRERMRPVSKRRRDVFEKCGGRCHYCARALTLTGPWHVEHALPRALGGLDEISNLFASCPPCNLSKSDRTALEFVAGRIAEGDPK